MIVFQNPFSDTICKKHSFAVIEFPIPGLLQFQSLFVAVGRDNVVEIAESVSPWMFPYFPVQNQGTARYWQYIHNAMNLNLMIAFTVLFNSIIHWTDNPMSTDIKVVHTPPVL